MQWERLTADDFQKAAADTGVCIVPMGVLERHSAHLPLGTDVTMAHSVACLAAEREPAVVYPPFHHGQIYEARCFPGTVTLPLPLLIEFIQATFAEIARNGFRKIIVHNGHGGNWALLRLLAQATLANPQPYALYLQTDRIAARHKEAYGKIFETTYHGHACEFETSAMLHLDPDAVHMDRVPAQAADSMKRTAHLPESFTGIWWYGNHPDHYAGDARTATAEKGRLVTELMVDSLCEFIAAVKADQVVPALEDEFFAREERIRR